MHFSNRPYRIAHRICIYFFCFVTTSAPQVIELQHNRFDYAPLRPLSSAFPYPFDAYFTPLEATTDGPSEEQNNANESLKKRVKLILFKPRRTLRRDQQRARRDYCPGYLRSTARLHRSATRTNESQVQLLAPYENGEEQRKLR